MPKKQILSRSGGAHSATVIVIKLDSRTRVQILVKKFYVTLLTNALVKSVYSSFFLAMGTS